MPNHQIRSLIAKRFRYAQDFARHIGWSSTTVYRVLNGRRSLSKPEAYQWAWALGCDVTQLEPALSFVPKRPGFFRRILSALLRG